MHTNSLMCEMAREMEAKSPLYARKLMEAAGRGVVATTTINKERLRGPDFDLSA